MVELNVKMLCIYYWLVNWDGLHSLSASHMLKFGGCADSRAAVFKDWYAYRYATSRQNSPKFAKIHGLQKLHKKLNFLWHCLKLNLSSNTPKRVVSWAPPQMLRQIMMLPPNYRNCKGTLHWPVIFELTLLVVCTQPHISFCYLVVQ